MTTQFLAALRNPSDPGAHSVTVDGDSLTWAELHSAGIAFAETLPDNGPIAVHAAPVLETVVAIVGCLLRGIVAVPVPPDVGASEVAHVVNDSGATTWVGPDRDGVQLPVIQVDRSARSSAAAVEVEPEHLGLILYTSGTTGAPKGVLLSHRALTAGIEALADAWAWTADDTVAHGLPLFHTHGLILGVLGSLHVGSDVIHTGKPAPDRYATANASMYFGVPTVWNRVVQDEVSAKSLASARLLVSGSAPLPVPVFERIKELTGHAPVERYGMTETMITLSTRADGERRPGWVGLPVLGVETRIRGEDGSVLSSDGESIGRLEVRGDMLFDGYLGLPEATASTWSDDGWFITGDLAVIDPDGFHRIVGRESVDLIKSGGYRIGAGEIETSLLALPEVREVAVIGAPDEDLGQRIVAFVVVDPEDISEELEQALVNHVVTDLAWHKRPREIRFVPTLPRNAMGKVQKKTLAV